MLTLLAILSRNQQKYLLGILMQAAKRCKALRPYTLNVYDPVIQNVLLNNKGLVQLKKFRIHLTTLLNLNSFALNDGSIFENNNLVLHCSGSVNII
jgi:hypothetical protein